MNSEQLDLFKKRNFSRNHLGNLELNTEKVIIINSRDAVGYYNLCNELGIEPELEELYERGKLEYDLEEKRLERLVDGNVKKNKVGRKRKIPRKIYEEFFKKANKQGLNPDAVFMQTEEKRSLLKEVLGYPSLKGSGEIIPITDCSDSKIGKAFRSSYISAYKLLNNQ